MAAIRLEGVAGALYDEKRRGPALTMHSLLPSKCRHHSCRVYYLVCGDEKTLCAPRNSTLPQAISGTA